MPVTPDNLLITATRAPRNHRVTFRTQTHRDLEMRSLRKHDLLNGPFHLEMMLSAIISAISVQVTYCPSRTDIEMDTNKIPGRSSLVVHVIWVTVTD